MSIARPLRLAPPVVVWLLTLAAASGSALAQPAEKGPTKAERAAARTAYDKGTTAFEHADYVAALDSFVKANALIPSVQAMFWIAQAQDKLGRTDAAVEAYQAITARADFAKLSEDKAATVRERLATLKAPAGAPVDATPPPEEPALPTPAALEPLPPPVEPTPEPPPAEVPAPAPGDPAKALRPKKNTAELGVMAGALVVSDSNNLVQGGFTRHAFKVPVVQVGVRAAFFPVTVFGVEAEWAHGFAATGAATGPVLPRHDDDIGATSFDTIRGHLIGQLPGARVVPFALLGAGWMNARSKQTGSDGDFLLQAGVGVKVIATKLLVPRLDLRMNGTQRAGGGFTEGIAFHPEVLLGLGFTLGR